MGRHFPVREIQGILKCTHSNYGASTESRIRDRLEKSREITQNTGKLREFQTNIICVSFAKMDQVLSLKNITLNKYWKNGKKYWKSQGILSVRKSGKHEKGPNRRVLPDGIVLVTFLQHCYGIEKTGNLAVYFSRQGKYKPLKCVSTQEIYLLIQGTF